MFRLELEEMAILLDSLSHVCVYKLAVCRETIHSSIPKCELVITLPIRNKTLFMIGPANGAIHTSGIIIISIVDCFDESTGLPSKQKAVSKAVPAVRRRERERERERRVERDRVEREGERKGQHEGASLLKQATR